MKNTVLILLSLSLLISCSGIMDAPEVEKKGKPGLFSKDSTKGISLSALLNPQDTENINVNVNGFLWRASLNVLSIAPLISTDSLGGTIVTDLYVNKNIKNQRIKITAFIKTSELKSEGISVKVHVQNLENGNWTNTVTNSKLQTQIENKILNEARNLRINSVK